MKNKCLKIFLLVVITLLLLNITVYADPVGGVGDLLQVSEDIGLIGDSYKGDTHYAMKIKYNGSERDAGIVLTHEIIRTKSGSNYKNELIIQPTKNRNIYVGDVINVDFYVISNLWSGEMKPAVQSKDEKAISTEGTIKNEPNYDGNNHVKINLKMTLLKSGDHTVQVLVEDDDYKFDIPVTVKGIELFGKKIENEYKGYGYIEDVNTEKLKAEGDTSNKKHVFSKSGTAEDRINNFVKTYGINGTDNEISDLKKENGQLLSKNAVLQTKSNSGHQYQYAEIGFNFKSTKDQTVYNRGVTRIFKWRS